MSRFGTTKIRLHSHASSVSFGNAAFNKISTYKFNRKQQSQTNNNQIIVSHIKSKNTRNYSTSTITQVAASASNSSMYIVVMLINAVAPASSSSLGWLGFLLGLVAGNLIYEEANADEPKVRDVANPFLKKGEKPKPGSLKIQYDVEKEEVFTVTNSSNTATEFRFAGKLQELVEEIGFWTVFNDRNKIGLNQRIETTNFFPVKPNTKLEIRGKVESTNQRRIVVRVIVLDAGVVLSSSKLTYILADFNSMSQLTGQQTGAWNPFIV